MKLPWGMTLEERRSEWSQKRARERAWHKHFTWLPRRVALRDSRWFEFVMRRRTDSQETWEYMALDTYAVNIMRGHV